MSNDHKMQSGDLTQYTTSCNRVGIDNVTWMCNSHNHPFHDLGGNIDLSSQLMIYETKTGPFNVWPKEAWDNAKWHLQPGSVKSLLNWRTTAL